MIVIAGDRVIEIRVDHSGSPRTMVLRIEVDYQRSWLFEEPGWQELSVGVVGEVAYCWSARNLIVLPADLSTGTPVVISADEDIVAVFAVSDSWLFVCETSVRLVTEDEIASRLEFGEVLLGARRAGSRFVIRDASGQDIEIAMSAGELEIQPR